MENKKCSSKEHNTIPAISYCQKCDLYMCTKCQKIHSNLCPHHHDYNLDKDVNEIFTGLCNEKRHSIELEYFCKNHNQLCCAACLCKIKGEVNGQHKDCDVCVIKDIKEEKKKNFDKNIQSLKDLSNTLEQTNKELILTFEKINKSKEELKLKIQKVFTKIRSVINEREDELLSEVDKIYESVYCSEEIIKESEKLPNKIKIALEKEETINNGWNDIDKLNLIINECIKIEKYIKDINIINNSIQKSKSNNNIKITFSPEENEINDFLKKIKNFGKINNDDNFMFTKSNIIKKEDQDLILSWFDKKPINFQLLLDSKDDGDSTLTFVNKCSSKYPTILFIKSTDGYRFGGFTSKKWGINENATDEKCFIFSLDLKEKYPISDNKLATRVYKSDWLSFGSGLSLYLYNGCTSRNDNYTCSTYFNFPKNKSEINGNNPSFTVSSYEVYQIEY